MKLGTEAATDGVLQKKVFLKISPNSQENTSVGVSFDKVAGQVNNFIKKGLQHRCFLEKFAKYLKTPIIQPPALNHYEYNALIIRTLLSMFYGLFKPCLYSFFYF